MSERERARQLTKIGYFTGKVEARISEIREAAQRLKAVNGANCLDCYDSGIAQRGICSCDAGKAEAERQEAERADARRAQFLSWVDQSLGIPPRFQAMRLETFPDPSSPVLGRIRRWVDIRTGPRGLIVIGPFGTGKTAIVVDVLRILVRHAGEAEQYQREPGRLGKFVTATGLLQSLRPGDGSAELDAKKLRHYQQVRYLAIDDLGAERLTAWGADRLFEVLNARHNELRPVLLTSNLPLSQLADRWNNQAGDEAGSRIVNRLIETCDQVEFGEDATNWRMQGERG